jgi:copper chaperone
MEKKILNVTGMSCEHCAAAVKNALEALTGLADVNVSLKDGTVSFSHDPALAPLETIGAAIRDEGYDFSSR